MQIEQRKGWKDVHLLSRLWSGNFAQTFQQWISPRFTEGLVQRPRKRFPINFFYEMVLRYIEKNKNKMVLLAFFQEVGAAEYVCASH